MKSMMRRPSQALPAGCPKKVSPFGDWISVNAEDIPPVSEFESPKLYIAGNPHEYGLPSLFTNPKTNTPNA